MGASTIMEVIVTNNILVLLINLFLFPLHAGSSLLHTPLSKIKVLSYFLLIYTHIEL